MTLGGLETETVYQWARKYLNILATRVAISLYTDEYQPCVVIHLSFSVISVITAHRGGDYWKGFIGSVMLEPGFVR